MKNKTIKTADILLPDNAIDLRKWSVIACDQYTSDLNYWHSIAENVKDSPSALHFIIPEVYLEIETQEQKENRIKNINNVMKDYLGNVLKCFNNSIIYVERRLKNGKTRQGIICALDLEEYNFSKDSVSAVRATEATVPERLPPRIQVRKSAPIESPHILVLYEDEKFEISTEIKKNISENEKIYDFSLMCDGGSVKGFALQGNLAIEVEDKINTISDKDIKFAVGDGNHSLATAKECYEILKKSMPEEEYKNHPSRYALVELVNIYDASLDFEPIYRILFDVNVEHLIKKLKENKYIKEFENADYNLELISGNKKFTFNIDDSELLVVAVLQKFLDKYLAEFGGRIDYIHGIEELKNLAQNENNVGFIFNTIKKSELFDYVQKNGPLERKTFSMGEADDKRFYLECRKIIL